MSSWTEGRDVDGKRQTQTDRLMCVRMCVSVCMLCCMCESDGTWTRGHVHAERKPTGIAHAASILGHSFVDGHAGLRHQSLSLGSPSSDQLCSTHSDERRVLENETKNLNQIESMLLYVMARFLVAPPPSPLHHNGIRTRAEHAEKLDRSSKV